MSRHFSAFRKVFTFTFSSHTKTKGYRAATFVTAFLLFLIPFVSMLATEFFAGDNTQKETNYQTAAQTVYVFDEVEGDFDYSRLNDMSFFLPESGAVNPVYLHFSDIVYQMVDSAKEGLEKGKEDPCSLVLSVTKDDQGVHFSVLIPENSSLTEDDAEGFSSYLSLAGNAVLLQKSGISEDALNALSVPVSSAILTGEETEEADPLKPVRDIFGMILPYVILMVLYFLILIYGQGVASSVVSEKSSKLMDTLLISVQPKDLIFGKMCAIALSGILQFFTWGVALVLGFAAGTVSVKALFPDTDMVLIRFFESFGSLSGVFTLPSVLITVLMVLGGFFLYCALAAVGGALASKAEELSATNYLFTMALVISFLCVLFGGGGIENIISGSSILDFIPFTAVLVVPSRILLGEISVFAACISLAMVLLATVLIVLLAGKVYRMMSFYRGKVPSVKQLLGMWKEK